MEPLAGVAPQLGDLYKSSLRLVTQLSVRVNPNQALRIHRMACVASQQDFYVATFQLQQDLHTIGFVVTEKNGCGRENRTLE